jgi:glycosyltransferase involved in cell wall biosynthesis
MIGFREPGYLWKIKGAPFIWGPIGGMENVPLGYLGGLSAKAKFTVLLKNLINSYQARYSLKVRSAIRESSALIAAVKGVKDKIQEFHGKQVILINETGCYPCDSAIKELNAGDAFNIIWVGKFDYRKQLSLALQSIQKVRHLKGVRFHIVGDGNASERKAYLDLADSLGIRELCVWHGLIPRESVQKLMKKSDLLLFTSIMEGTPHVVLEAIANNLPVLCFDACGQSAAVNESVGIKLDVTSQKQSITDFAYKIEYLYGNPDVLHEMSLACLMRQKELSWDSKAKQMLSIYEMVLSRFD